MKLYLHNLLHDIDNGQHHYPLRIIPTEVQSTRVEFQRDVVLSLAKRIDLSALASACRDIGISVDIPLNADTLTDTELLSIHHALFEIEVVSGELVSPSGKKFPIVCGIPDMSHQT